MALSPVTPRDHLQRLVDLARKTWRYWWLVVIFAVVGAGLSLAFAVTRPRIYQSWATLFYQERIQSQLLSPNREEIAQRSIGDRYRELLLARKQLEQILSDPTLDPYPKEKDPDIKVEKLRLAVHFVSRGAMAYRIEYSDSDPERARRVTAKLTKLLQETEEAMRNEQAAETVRFATEQKNAAAAELKTAELALTEFLAKHPEFAADANATGEGASIRAAHSNKPTPTANPRLSGAERQLQRIQALLDAPPDAPSVKLPIPSSPERIAAEAAVQDAQRELAAAKRELEEVLSKFTDKHPSAIKAQERVNSAQQRLRSAQAAVPPEVETVVRPATAPDRAELESQRQRLLAEIRNEQSKTGNSTDAQTGSEEVRVVQLESENSELRRAAKERRDRLEALTQGEFRARQDASQKLAEQGGRLSIVDPAFKPVRPSGPGKTIFLMAGMILFLALGLGLAVALAVIDDRLYRRSDLDYLGVAVLAVIPPPARIARKPRHTRTQRKDKTGVA